MTPDVLSLEASYAACRALTRRAHSSFEASFCLLPRAKHRAMRALYAFMRHTDDLGDNGLPVERRAKALRGWRDDLSRALGGTAGLSSSAGVGWAPPTLAQDVVGGAHPTNLPSGADKHTGGQATRATPQADPVDRQGRRLLPAVADTVRRFGIPPGCLHAVIDGQEMDLAGRRYETFAQLCEYCEKVASAVGLACIHVWGFRSSDAIEPARQCGIALQLTNILRDLQEDAAAGRCYLPAEDLAQSGYTFEQLQRGDAGPGFLRLMELEVGRAEAAYRAGWQVVGHLGDDGRRACGAMIHTYHELLRRIAARPREVLLRRVRLSRWAKCRAMFRGFLLRALPTATENRVDPEISPRPS